MKQIQVETKSINLSLLILGIGFSSAIALIIFAVATINYQNKQTFDDFVSSMNLSHQKIDHAYNLNLAAYRRGYYQYQMILTEDPFDRDELFLEYNKTAYEVNYSRNEILQLITNLDEHDLIEQQEGIINNIRLIHQGIIDALYRDDLKTAAELRTRAFEAGDFAVFIDNVNTLAKLQKKQLELELKLSTREYEKTQFLSMLILLAIVFIIFLLGAYVLSRIRNEATKIKSTLYLMDNMNAKHLYDSLHDTLTNLPNRANFFKTAEQEISESNKHSNHDLYVLFFDLDRFKLVNDRYGHEAGDNLLKELSKKLISTFKNSMFIARMGGDEFVGITKVSSDEIGNIAKQIINLVCTPFCYDGKEIIIGSSIGISQLGKDGDDADILVRLADIAMYVAKKEQGNTYRFASELDPDLLNTMLPNMSSGRNRN